MLRALLLETARNGDGIYASNMLIHSHGKRGEIQEAFRVFHSMLARNDFSWTILLGACLANDRLDAALQIFDRMPQADAVAGTALLGKFARSRGAKIDQALAFFNTLALRDLVSWNCALGIAAAALEYVSIDRALFLFHRMPQWNAVSLGSLLAAFVKSEDEGRAFDFFACMPSRSIISWTTMLRCASTFRVIFDRMPARNLVSWNAALAQYARSGGSDCAFAMFECLPERDFVSWTTHLAACVENDHVKNASKIFSLMPFHDLVASTAMISFSLPEKSLEILESMPLQDAAPWNAILRTYLRHGDRQGAWNLFERMPQRNLISWNTLLAGLASLSDEEETLEKKVFSLIPQRNAQSWNAIIVAYAQQGEFEKASKALDLMPERTVVSWTALIVACGTCVNAATWALETMPVHSLVTWTAVLTVYAQSGHLEQAKNLFNSIPQRDLVCWNTMIALYGHNGKLDLVSKVFNSMAMRDLISWALAIAANSQNGELRNALSLFWAMLLQGIAPNGVVFCGILSGCSHAGDLATGFHCFRSMILDHELDPSKEHYSCIVDLLGRADQLDRARDLVQHMPFLPDVEWTSLTIHHYSTNTWRAGKWSVILPPGKILLDAVFA